MMTEMDIFGGGGIQGIHDHYDTYSSASTNSIVYDLDFDPTMIFVKGTNYGTWAWWSSSWIKNDTGAATQSWKTTGGTYGTTTYNVPDTAHGPAINIVNNRHIEITLSGSNVVDYDVDIWIM